MTAKDVETNAYFEGVGRRKQAVARVRITPSNKASWTVNGKQLEEYFSVEQDRQKARQPFDVAPPGSDFAVSVIVRGGGVSAQAEAIRHGLSRAFILADPELRPKLKEMKFLTRDSRMKERYKFGLKKARKSPQWSKR